MKNLTNRVKMKIIGICSREYTGDTEVAHNAL